MFQRLLMSKSMNVNRHGWRVASVVFLVSIVIIAGCTIQGKDKGEVSQAPIPQGVSVDARIVKPKPLQETLEVAGSLVANQEVDITSELTRKIVHVHAKEGNFVKAGTLLFQLDDADLVAQLEQLQQREKLAALNEARFKDLIEHDAAVQQDYDQASTNLNVLKAEIRQLQVTLDKTRIRAPFDGRIGIIRSYRGALVSSSTVLANFIDDRPIKVEFSVPEKYANMIAHGSNQNFTVESDTTRYVARVVASESRLNETTRTLLIRGVSPNPGGVLIPGQSARLTLTVHTAKDALMVSSQALIPSSQGYSVYVARNKQVTLAPVEIGQRDPYDVQILKGLSAGDTVITSNLLRLVPGVPVEFATIN
jgi:membrane fusion protein (multidrug efflux system)